MMKMAKDNTQETAIEEIREEAHYWRALLDDDVISNEEIQAFKTWCAEDPRHEEEYKRLEVLWERLGAVGEQQLNSENLSALKRARSNVSRFKKRLGIFQPLTNIAPLAACIAIIVFASIVFVNYETKNESLEGVSSAIAIYATKRGEVNRVILSDGSVAHLGANSEIGVSLTSTKRYAELRKGEVFFDVKKDTVRPFTVTANDLRVEVIGTAFSVRLGNKRIDVAVSEGNVDVSYPVMINSESIQMRERRKIDTGMAVTATERQGLLEPEKISLDVVAPWRNGRLVYIATPLSEVIADTNRYSNILIVIEDEDVGNIAVSGSFNADKPEEVLDILSEILPIKIENIGPNTVRIAPAIK